MKHRRGFTLVELLVVIAIIGILAAIAIPQYADYVTRSRLPDGVSTLANMRVRMEQFFQDNRTYVGACVAGTAAPLPAATATFTFACSNLAATTFTVTATGIGTMNGFVFTVNESNVRQTTGVPSGWSLPAGNCWVSGKGGMC